MTEATTGFTLMDLFETAVDPEGTPLTRKVRGVYLGTLAAQEGTMVNGKISVTVSTNNLVVALKTLAGNDPSSTEPVGVKINNTARFVTGALSITLAAGTNWFNSGGAELATKEVDYFLYAVWDSVSSAVALAPARCPYGRVVSDFNSTTTAQDYLGNYANYTSTDDVTVIGRFAATLSAGSGYTWTVPTFTSSNLIQSPIHYTRVLTFTPTQSRSGTNYTNQPAQNSNNWQIVEDKIYYFEVHTQNATPGGTGDQKFTTIWTNPYTTRQLFNCENGSDSYVCVAYVPASSSTVTIKKYDGTTDVTASKQYVTMGFINMR